MYFASENQRLRTCSFDRYRTVLKNTWKDLPIPANGLTYDLGAHLIDQALVLFGRPQKITAFVENVRGIGHKDVDDAVRRTHPPLRSVRLMPAAVHHLPALSGPPCCGK